MSDSIITIPSYHKDIVWVERSFHYTGHPGWGYCFDVKDDGSPRLENEAQKASFADALAQTAAGTMVDEGNIERLVRSKFFPAEGKCECGEVITLDGGPHGLGNTCECGRCYDMGGHSVLYVDRAGYEANGGWYAAGEDW